MSGSAGNKLRTYKLFKTEFQLEGYLTHVHITKYRVALTRLRVSCHNLQIELGRFHKPSIPPEQRLCAHCQQVEGEIHFLCVCPVYHSQREEVFSAACLLFPGFAYISTKDKLIYLMQSVNPTLMNILAKFVYVAFKLHASLLYF